MKIEVLSFARMNPGRRGKMERSFTLAGEKEEKVKSYENILGL